MKGDFSRLTWDRRRRYAGVLMQQGRLQLDADWNEQVDIGAYRLESAIADVVGHSGVPGRTPDGFRIELVGDLRQAPVLRVAPGRIYVAGRALDNDAPLSLPVLDLLPDLSDYDNLWAAVYLDTWQRHVTAADDPALREVALGGPDTATRVQHAWRIGSSILPFINDYPVIGPGWRPPVPNLSTGLLDARADLDRPVQENQLYRVEVHSVTGQDVRFTWSRENGAVTATVSDVQSATRTLTVGSVGRDRQHGLAERQWIELVVDPDKRGPVVQVERVTDGQLVATAASWPWTGRQAPAVRLVRRWDGATGLVTATGGWQPLEQGIQVRFAPAPTGAASYVPGDYWLVPARAATGGIEWPPGPQPAHGVRHEYAPLAVITRDSEWRWSLDADVRVEFGPRPSSGAVTGRNLQATSVSGTSARQAAASGPTPLAVGAESLFGSPTAPVDTTGYGSLSVSGVLSAQGLDVRRDAVVQGPLSVGGWLAVGGAEPPTFTALHITRDDGAGPLVGLTGRFDLRTVARELAAAPAGTTVIAGQSRDGDPQQVYLFWRDHTGALWGTALAQDPAITASLRTAAKGRP
ncbi:DUF6519 domain-containing protein [Micromonospora endophytica]|uniref:Uncharacterized protein n=1 Tax=Micromonospora endophytica TaxID=515350 RepID=A0A2W2DYQ1_9ACTN|nr:DUF6519 domain-containing protein [Micromonospora endophytica]PZF98013.1 hypothetical protein C1I93_09970 [Micromonospora endophytica]RIW49860.1 hypothetical protein D3H59_03620 [Micromonospora endophytica]BCJ57206.1 hypothetical protein Jiend_06280 [Micromonospora endophytica]